MLGDRIQLASKRKTVGSAGRFAGVVFGSNATKEALPEVTIEDVTGIAESAVDDINDAIQSGAVILQEEIDSNERASSG